MVFSPASNPNARRLHWALLIALALHLLLAWHFAPNLSARFEAVRKAITEPDEAVVEITTPPPAMSRGMTLSTKLGEAAAQSRNHPLPADFFKQPKGMAGGHLEISDSLDFSRKSGLQIVANIVPGTLRLRNLNTLSNETRSPRPRRGESPAPTPAPAVKTPTATQTAPPAEAPQPLLTLAAPPPEPEVMPFLLPAPELAPPTEPPAPEVDVDAVIARAADEAERTAREVRRRSAIQSAPDYRALLPQGPMAEAPQTPQTPQHAAPSPSAGAPESSGITTYALDAPPAVDRRRAAPEDGNLARAARQQFFALLTARLKAANNRMLAESLKASQRTTVRMTFLLDRDGTVVSISPGDPVTRELALRAAAVIRAATLPPVPASMAEVPVELSFPVEVYR